MPKKLPINIRLFKTSHLPELEAETIKLLIHFVTFAAKKLGISEKPFQIRLLHAAPMEPITTGAYQPGKSIISVIVQNRHFIDYCRTIAHEMVHQKQDYQGRVGGPVPEIGGDIEDEANFMSGRIVKEFIKKQLSDKQKKYLGLGTY